MCVTSLNIPSSQSLLLTMSATRQRLLGVDDGPLILADKGAEDRVAAELNRYNRSLYFAELSAYVDALKHLRDIISNKTSITGQDVGDLQWLTQELEVYQPAYYTAVNALGCHWSNPYGGMDPRCL
ncbi:hypothetical protein FA13DRAFT_1800661 [Coprinellus micaceus]|uniref:Uncharacterized protein n=1 Tax=Coprinellus micaceus TaxID=71717 RepID=A0A4Y7SHR9_COPMI|nr:hypothetical protein FA13DRAFT_1800661 [Coprinellus micaceus]